MANIVSFEIKGLDELQKALEEEQPKKARLAMKIALSAGGGTVRDAMRQDAPVEIEGQNSGFLRDHLKVKTIIKQGGLVGIAIVGATTDPYPKREGKFGTVTLKTRSGKVVSFLSKKAGQVTAAMVAKWLEYGTSKMSKHPWMTKAWEASKQAALDRIVAKLKDGLDL
jgi:HK97 gp10 family phage protein